MSKFERDESREEQIDMEVVVDAYNEEERRMGWYYYLDNKTQEAIADWYYWIDQGYEFGD